MTTLAGNRLTNPAVLKETSQMEPNVAALNQRIESLEKQYGRTQRWLRLLTAALLILLTAALSGAARTDPATSVAAQEFLLYDSGNKVRAALRMKDGGPSFTLYDDNEEGRVSLLIEHSSASFQVSYPRGVPAIEMTAADARPSIAVWSEREDKPQILARIGKSIPNGPTLEIFDSDGIKAASFGGDYTNPILRR